jgi:Family of unknown function (DUF5694)
MKRNLWLCLLLCFGFELSFGQRALRPVASFYPCNRPQVLVVGCFHFDDPGLDAHVTDTLDKVDVLSPKRQVEMENLVRYIERFRPNKIAIEAYDEWQATAHLHKYKTGKVLLGRDERYQLGIRIAADMDLDTIFSIDSGSLVEELEKKDASWVDSLFQDYDFESRDSLVAMSKTWLSYEDKVKARTSLLAYFKRLNSPEYHRYGYGIYLIGDFLLDQTRGADLVSVWWYNRNLRIFRRLQDITEGANDRILLIIGNGHAALLRQLLECSPAYEWVEFGKLKK